MPTILRSTFTARPSQLPPDGVRTKRAPRILYRSADAPSYSYDTGAPVSTDEQAVLDAAARDRAAQAGKQAGAAAGQIGKTIADTIGSIFGRKPPAPRTPAERTARDATLYVVAGAAIVAVVLVLRAKR